jgi:hypothetical protein
MKSNATKGSEHVVSSPAEPRWDQVRARECFMDGGGGYMVKVIGAVLLSTAILCAQDKGAPARVPKGKRAELSVALSLFSSADELPVRIRGDLSGRMSRV